MKKLEILLQELNNNKKINLIKFIIIEIIVLLISGGIFLAKVPFNFQLLIVFLGALLIFLIGFLYYKKINVIKYLNDQYDQNRYLEGSEGIINLLKIRKTRYLDIFDFTNEKLLFMEIIRILSIYDKFNDYAEIGPWEISYDKVKTQKFYQNLQLKQKNSIYYFKNNINKVPLEVQNLLKEIGINFEKVYDIWGSLQKNKSELELMYPVFGLLLNDSQILKHGLKYKQYVLGNNMVIKPYERLLDDDSCIMFHVKIKL